MSQEPSVLQVIVLLPCIEEPFAHSNKAIVVNPSVSNVTEPFLGVDSVLHGSIYKIYQSVIRKSAIS